MMTCIFFVCLKENGHLPRTTAQKAKLAIWEHLKKYLLRARLKSHTYSAAKHYIYNLFAYLSYFCAAYFYHIHRVFHMLHPFRLAVLACLCVLACSCSSSSTVDKAPTVETLYQDALQEFADNNWLGAQRLFDIIKLQYPASQYADDAQFYLAEISFEKTEYILAAFNYSVLRRSFPNSEYIQRAMYKTAESYYALSPEYFRDQEYTRKAIDAYREYAALYPSDSLATQAKGKITELRSRLGESEFETARLYINLQSPRSALVYFDEVIANFADTPWCERAFSEKLSLLIDLGREEEAKEAARLYLERFPKGLYVAQAKETCKC